MCSTDINVGPALTAGLSDYRNKRRPDTGPDENIVQDTVARTQGNIDVLTCQSVQFE